MAMVEVRNATNMVLQHIESSGDAIFTVIPATMAPHTTTRWEVFGVGTSTFTLIDTDASQTAKVTFGWMTMLAGTRFFARPAGKHMRVRQGQQPHDNLFTIVMPHLSTIAPAAMTPMLPPTSGTITYQASSQFASTNVTLVTAAAAPIRPRIGMPRHLGLLIPTIIIAVAAILLAGMVTATHVRSTKAVIATMTPTASPTTTPTATLSGQANGGQPTPVSTPTGVKQSAGMLVPVVTIITVQAHPTPTMTAQAPTPVSPTAMPIPPTATPVPAGNLALNFTQAFASCTDGFFIATTATNTGGQSLTWSATATVNDGTPFAVPSPAIGTLAAGQRTYISINGRGAAKTVLLSIDWTSNGQSHTAQVTYTCN